MEAAFVYDTFVTGKKFIGRKDDVRRMVNLIESGENIAVYGEPGTGKMSLIQEALMQLNLAGTNIRLAHVDLMRARKTDEILVEFASGVLKAFASSPSEYKDAMEKYLSGSHFVFDKQQYALRGQVISTNWLVDEVDARMVFNLPSSIASDNLSSGDTPAQDRLVVLVTQFQNILFSKEYYSLLKLLEKAVEDSGKQCNFIFTGSHMNAIKEIFDVQKWFWRSVERFALSPIKPTEIADHIYRVFQNHGKVLDKDLIINASQLLRCNMRYVNFLFGIVHSIAHGYINKPDVDNAMKILVSIHRPRFFSTVCSLTDFQLSLLRAIIAGEVRFSSSSIIDKYQLNSSANVNRLKEALIKKEVVWFDEKEEPHVMDPLFEYWLLNEYLQY